MSIIGYFIPRSQQGRTEKIEIDPAIRVEGDIIEGNRILKEALSQAIPTRERTYGSTTEYDPVLASHCRFPNR